MPCFAGVGSMFASATVYFLSQDQRRALVLYVTAVCLVHNSAVLGQDSAVLDKASA